MNGYAKKYELIVLFFLNKFKFGKIKCPYKVFHQLSLIV